MRLLVCGGRDYASGRHVWTTLDDIQRERGYITALIHGAASGADSIANEWAKDWNLKNPEWRIEIIAFPADWKALGPKAGPIRNGLMLEQKPDLVVAFPGGRGTADMMRRARAAGLEVVEVAR